MPLQDVQRLEEGLRNLAALEAMVNNHLASFGVYRDQIAGNDQYIREYFTRLGEQRLDGMQRLQEAKTIYAQEVLEEARLAESLDAELKEIPIDNIEPNEDLITIKLLNPFLIGADPEFAAYKKCIGSPANLIKMGLVSRDTSTINFDHNGDVLELNPRPARSSFRLIRNIRKDLVESKYIQMLLRKGLRLRAGAYVKTSQRELGLGGHIHFDIPFCDEKEYGLLGRCGRNVLLLTASDSAKKLAGTLDILVAYLEKLDILPLKDSEHRREYCAYGHFGDIRCSNQGNRLEYRTMCSWLHSPITAMICLTAAKLAVARPNLVTEHLTVNYSEAKLRKFFEMAAPLDSDASRIVERIYEKDVKPQVKPDIDLTTSWKSLSVLGV